MDPLHVQIRDSARKWGVPEADMLHAFRYARKVVPQEYAGHEQFLIIGPGRDAQLLELIVPGDEPQRIIHAMELRPKFHRYLE